MVATAMSGTDKPQQPVMNIVSWRKAAAEAVNAPLSVAIVNRVRRQTERCRPTLRVVEGGRARLIADIERFAEELGALEQRLANAREETCRLLAALRER
jgi:hypothetical protein